MSDLITRELVVLDEDLGAAMTGAGDKEEAK